ncbi:MAG: 2-hydroxyacid dehydrogenase [Thermoguttaceae bacterium]|nr:2-hydroxyacid dehydrogenase [Thermoguttaceae bacterium]MDW8037730.1 2-hydroxyacid dehydrogenase [Thermoguttaceae bacterium]
MKTAVFSTRSYDECFLKAANQKVGHELHFFEARLTWHTCRLAEGFPAVCVFVNDQLDRPVLEKLAAGGTRLIALRCAGFNNVDLRAAQSLGFTVARVPAYSPHAVAEHTIALVLALIRRLHKAYNRVREGNFNLEGLLGFDLYRKTVGVIGTGKIGSLVAKAFLAGFGCRVLCHDVHPNRELVQLGAEYVRLESLCAESDIITLHCPLLPETYHLINETTVHYMKEGVILINTSRGALVDTRAVIRGLKTGKIGGLGLDVYEEEADLFFEDLSTRIIQDDVFARMLTFPNVIITGHQAFFTQEALEAIAAQTLENISAFEQGLRPPGLIEVEKVLAGQL